MELEMTNELGRRIEKAFIHLIAVAISRLMIFVLLSPVMILIIIAFADIVFALTFTIGEAIAIWFFMALLL
jgi:hypothetical protein